MLSRSSLPVLLNVLIRAEGSKVEIMTTSLESAVRVSLECKVERAGETTVPGRALLEFVGQLDEGEVTIEKLGEEVVIACGGASARFATIASGEFPAIPKFEGGKKFIIKAHELAKCISSVFFCAAQDESRPILAGVLFDCSKGMSLVATDGFRLGSYHIEMPKGAAEPLKFVVPARALQEIPKIVAETQGEKETDKSIEMIVSDNLTQAVFKMDSIEFTTRLIEGSYPQWEKLVPANFSTKIVINKEALSRAIKIAAIFARDAGSIVKFKLSQEGKKGLVLVSSNTAQVGSSDSKVVGEMVGPGGEIAFNFRYVLEALASIDDEDVVFEMNESLNPGRLSPKDSSSSFHIIMPVRLQG